MIESPRPCDESRRLAALRRYGVLDTPAEERFDRITRMVSRQFGVPISLVSLVDAERQWFKSACGLPRGETPRNVAFCAHAILSDAPLVVENAQEDPRFACNPLVTGEPNIRFYAGVPLITPDRFRLGTLCAIDRVPRRFSSEQVSLLQDLGKIVIDEIELSSAVDALRKHADELQSTNEALRTFSHSLSHDLAAPLRRIVTLCEFLDEGDADEAPELVHHIRDSARYSDTLLRDLRDFFATSSQPAIEEVDAREVLDEAASDLPTPLSRIGGKLEVPSPLPVVAFPKGMLRLVLANLLANCVKYRSERELVITVRTVETEQGHEISITDNGIGIESRYRDAVFEPLRRLHRHADVPGSGLGLSTCKRILERAGGHIELESETGVGTTVTCFVPKRVRQVTAPDYLGSWGTPASSPSHA